MEPAAYVLDRVEDGAWAVLEPEDEGAALELPRGWLPHEASEGDVVVVELEADGLVRFRVDAEAREKRRDRLRELRDEIPRGPSGDLEL